jgi:parvulin-like peptidyl-prolyl isomerase
MEEARAKIDSGVEFSEVAKEYSDAPDASDGGSIGEMKEEDLSQEIFGAVLSLKDGDISETVANDIGIHLFKVNGRTKRDDTPSEEVMAKARSILEQEQAERRVATYFTSEIYKLHHVDKKV